MTDSEATQAVSQQNMGQRLSIPSDHKDMQRQVKDGVVFQLAQVGKDFPDRLNLKT